MPKPLLSICLPTRNRAAYLEPHLRELTAPGAFGFPVEIVIGDNCSEDDTPRIVAAHVAAGAPVRYLRQPRDVGFQANLFSLFRAAEGEFAIYLADDDRLVPAALGDALAALQRQPELVALYGPWEAYDATTKAVSGKTFVLPEPIVYGPRDRLALLRMMLERNIIPEVPIMRTRVLGATLYRSTDIYWAFTLLDRLLEGGAVLFTGTPYYRVVGQHWPGEDRSTVLTRWTLYDWEVCRRGLEYFFWRARGVSPPLPAEEHAAIAAQIDARSRFLASNAAYARYIANDHVGATEAGMLAAASGVPVYEETRKLSRLFAAVDLLLEVFDATAGATRLALLGFQAPQAITQLVHIRRPDLGIDAIAPLDRSAFDGCLLVAVDHRHREMLLDAGAPPGRVLDFDRLLRFVTIPEGGAA